MTAPRPTSTALAPPPLPPRAVVALVASPRLVTIRPRSQCSPAGPTANAGGHL